MMRVSFIAGLMLATQAAMAPALSLTYTEWSGAPAAMKEGYVWGVVESLAFVGDDDKAKARGLKYQDCLSSERIYSDRALAIIEDYVARTVDPQSVPMIGLVLKAMRDTCSAYLAE
jgi:hypothetical protein